MSEVIRCRGRIQRAPQPQPSGESRGRVWRRIQAHPHGKSEGGPGGHCNLHPHGRAGGGSRGHHNPYPAGKLIPGIRGAEALPGRYQHCAQGVWQGLAGFPTRNDVAGICSRSIAWINLPHTAWDRLVLLPCRCIAHGQFQGGKSINSFRTQDFHAFTSSSSSGSSSNHKKYSP